MAHLPEEQLPENQPAGEPLPPDRETRFLAAAEEALVHFGLRHPGELGVGDENVLRQALALARLAPQGSIADRRALAEFRRAGLAAAFALFGEAGAGVPHSPSPELLRAAAARLWRLTLSARDRTAEPARWEAALRRRQLVLALAGGGGTAYAYLGCFDLLEEWGLRPELIAGTSHGAIVGLFRARTAGFRTEDLAGVIDSLSFKKLFRLFRVRSHYALPGPLQLFLRSALLPVLQQLAARGEAPGPALAAQEDSDGAGGLSFADLPIPLVVAVAGVRSGMLPRPPKEYERLFDLRAFFPPTPGKLQRRLRDLFSVLGEFVRQPNRLDPLYLGSDPGTAAIDVLDAIGFSCSLPGFIHYDVVRDDPQAHQALRALLQARELSWFADGGLVENCPVRAAHVAFLRNGGGRQGPAGESPNPVAPRNGLVLALDAFSPKLATAPWLPLQRLAHETVRRALPYADLYLPFARTLSPLSVLPSAEQVARAIVFGRARLSPEMPYLAKMLTPLPALETSRPA